MSISPPPMRLTFDPLATDQEIWKDIFENINNHMWQAMEEVAIEYREKVDDRLVKILEESQAYRAWKHDRFLREIRNDVRTL